MKVLLINPVIRENDVPRNIPHGIAIMAAVAREHKHQVELLDINALRLSREEVVQRIERADCDVVGIGGLIPVYGYVKWLAAIIKEHKADVPVLLGGSVGFSIPELILSRTDVDVVCHQEGEATFPELLKALEQKQPLSNVKGIWYREDGEIRQTEPRPLIRNLDAVVPFPAWDLLPMEVYLSNPVVGIGRDIDFIASRGCPYHCTFCYQAFGRTFRPHSVDYVMTALRLLKAQYDIDFVSFQDDEFLASKKRFFEFCKAVRHSGLALKWSCTGRVNLVSRDILQAAKDAGCVSVNYGIESGSQRMLDTMKKGVTVEQAKNAIRLNREVGLRCPTSFIVGMPGETHETIEETIEFCKDVKIPLRGVMFATPYPGTPLFEDALAQGLIDPDRLEEFVLRLGDAVSFTINLTGTMSNEELIAAREYMIAEVDKYYEPPPIAEREAFLLALYGEELYRKAKEQELQPAFQSHRKLHGFNEA